MKSLYGDSLSDLEIKNVVFVSLCDQVLGEPYNYVVVDMPRDDVFFSFTVIKYVSQSASCIET